jgi:hypothetical protein
VLISGQGPLCHAGEGRDPPYLIQAEAVNERT